MNIQKSIENLKEYIETDYAYKEPEKNVSDFDKFCYSHCKDIDAVINELDKVEADLYEANNIINDLLDLVKQKDKIIDDMAENYSWNVSTDVLDICAKCKCNTEDCHGDYCKEALIKYFEERCK